MTSEKRVAHLWNFAVSMNGDTHTKKLLKSNFINISRKLAGSSNAIFSKSQMCSHCGIHWEDNSFQMKLKPQGLQITTNKARKLITKLKEQQACPEKRLLTKKQKQRAKWLLKRAASKLELNCEFCKHKTLITLDKTQKEKAVQKTKKLQLTAQVESLTTTTNSAGKTKKKKKNTKDKTAGLKVQIKQEKKLPIVPKVTPTLSNGETKKIKSKALKQTPPPPKIQSKTQKQNSLLQLAALLKAKDNSNMTSNKNANNRLDKFLN